MANIVIPMAGAGSRFIEAGYVEPKPFIDLHGRSMIEQVVDNITEPGDTIFLLCRAFHFGFYRRCSLIHRPDLVLHFVEELTEGAVCTVLTVQPFIDNATPLIIANSDQWMAYDRTAWRGLLRRCDAAIMTFPSQEAKWSYARVDGRGRVKEVAEKRAISEHATVGVYAFSQGSTFVAAAQKMIAADKRVNNEFYVCPVFNEIVKEANVRIFPVKEMYGLGDPTTFEISKERLAEHLT